MTLVARHFFNHESLLENLVRQVYEFNYQDILKTEKAVYSLILTVNFPNTINFALRNFQLANVVLSGLKNEISS